MTADPASTVASDEPRQLLDTLIEQLDLYQRLKSLSDQQSALIAGGQTQQLLQVLTERQGLVESLNHINQRLGPYRNRWASVARQLPQADQEKLRTLVSQVQTLLEQIIEQDELDKRQLESAQADVGRQLRQVTRTGTVVNAYRQAPVISGARFTDRRG